MGVSWLKKGEDSEKVAKQAAAEAEARKAEMGAMFRFFVQKDEDARITFVDGELSDQGFLLPPRFYEHTLYHAGKWTNFVCPEKTNPELGQKCPICEAGDYASLVALFTVIDHRSYKSPTTGKTYQDTPKIFAAKSQTFEILNKMAIKRGGLAGCTFDVSRTGDKSAAVGNVFDFVEKNALKDLQGKWTRTYKNAQGKEIVEDSFKPADYEKEIVWRDADELRALGFGKPGVGGGPTHSTAAAKAAKPEDYEEHL